jgi:hypothetical protein
MWVQGKINGKLTAESGQSCWELPTGKKQVVVAGKGHGIHVTSGSKCKLEVRCRVSGNVYNLGSTDIT